MRVTCKQFPSFLWLLTLSISVVVSQISIYLWCIIRSSEQARDRASREWKASCSGYQCLWMEDISARLNNICQNLSIKTPLRGGGGAGFCTSEMARDGRNADQAIGSWANFATLLHFWSAAVWRAEKRQASRLYSMECMQKPLFCGTKLSRSLRDRFTHLAATCDVSITRLTDKWDWWIICASEGQSIRITVG